MKRQHHLSAVHKKLIGVLEKIPGFFRHGNKIRLTIHLDVRESAVLALLETKASQTVKDIIEHEIGFLSQALEWDGQEFWLEPRTCLIGMIASYPLFTDFDAIQNDLEYIYVGYPFVVCKSICEELYRNRFIRCQIECNQLKIGIGDCYLVSQTPINTSVVTILKQFPFSVRIELDD